VGVGEEVEDDAGLGVAGEIEGFAGVAGGLVAGDVEVLPHPVFDGDFRGRIPVEGEAGEDEGLDGGGAEEAEGGERAGFVEAGEEGHGVGEARRGGVGGEGWDIRIF